MPGRRNGWISHKADPPAGAGRASAELSREANGEQGSPRDHCEQEIGGESAGSARNADTDGFSDCPDGMAGFAQPERAGGAKVDAVVKTVDLKSGGEAPGTAGEIEKSRGLAVALH